MAIVGCTANASEDPRTQKTEAIVSQSALEVSIQPVPAASSAAAPKINEPVPDPGPAPEPVPNDVLTISAVGDCTLGDPAQGELVPGSFHRVHWETGEDMRRPFSGVYEVLSKDDLTIANLEGTLTTAPGKEGKLLAFRGLPEFVHMLVAGSVEVVNLANNHIFDCDSLGLRQTRGHLSDAGVGYFGIGTVDKRTIKGVDIYNLGYYGGTIDLAEEVENTVRKLKRKDNLVFVSFHGGIEGSHDTTLLQHQLAHAAVDAGADMVIGHHPHVLQGIEEYKGSPIAYSLGNFVFGGAQNPVSFETIILQARFQKKDGEVVLLGHDIIPAAYTGSPRSNDYRPILLHGQDADRVREHVRAYSKALQKTYLEGVPKP